MSTVILNLNEIKCDNKFKTDNKIICILHLFCTHTYTGALSLSLPHSHICTALQEVFCEKIHEFQVVGLNTEKDFFLKMLREPQNN